MMRVRFFGDFAMHACDRPVDTLRGRTSSLFQFLLLNRGQTVRRERLHEVLWPGREWSSTDSSLKVAVHALRRALRTTADDGAELPVEIAGQDHGYALHADDLWVDVDEFETCMSEGQVAESAGDDDAASRAYHRAVDLYRGDLLGADLADWIVPQREYNRALVLYALGWLRADALRRGRHAEVITLCRRVIGIDPYHEEMYQTLMLVHGRRGELGQVRNWHRLCVSKLRDDLDVAPTATTRRIYHRAVRGELREPVLTG
ncbi:AfsR/SARP family transcriptional regulator [Actinophytocola oryzae]|uniref:DNA-binding SARP family transcriptional activator n=1 Tax=Actinophytocola oryzae TaxID=502181 RepID=A0A4R7VW32_9PSEU|nr:BTAD domain-containing putative transcriptional regulator [Actinophytocola oryzae]TDV54243.1 DNA-binding SARP family transcriptional activator [Actinophytocola oryzae]